MDNDHIQKTATACGRSMGALLSVLQVTSNNMQSSVCAPVTPQRIKRGIMLISGRNSERGETATVMTPRKQHDDEPNDEVDVEAQLIMLSRALSVDRRLVDSELLAFVTNKQVARHNIQVDRTTILEAWSYIPLQFRTNVRARETPADATPKVILSGASPRSSTVPLTGTRTHPQLTRLVTTYIKQVQPDFCFTIFAIREDQARGPHRDVRNGPCGTFFQTLI